MLDDRDRMAATALKRTGSWKPSVNEPAWEMVSTISAKVESPVAGSTKTVNAISTKVESPAPEPPKTINLKKPAFPVQPVNRKTSASTFQNSPSVAKAPERKDSQANEAQVGIARQVSVSRAARPVNILKPKLTSPERLVDKKPLTPTLVELNKNRKSQRAQIEDA